MADHFKTLESIYEKTRAAIPALTELLSNAEHTQKFFNFILAANIETFTPTQRVHFVACLNELYTNLEQTLVRETFWKTLLLPLWASISPNRLSIVLAEAGRFISRIEDKLKALTEKVAKNPNYMLHERTFIPKLLLSFHKALAGEIKSQENIQFLENFVEFLHSLLSQITTRRFFRAYMLDQNTYARCRVSPLYKNEDRGKRFRAVVGILRFYLDFPINDYSGAELKHSELQSMIQSQAIVLQRVCWKFFPELKHLSLSHQAILTTRKTLRPHLDCITTAQLASLATRLSLIGEEEASALPDTPASRDFLLEVLVYRHEKPDAAMETINKLALYPNETLLWDPDIIITTEAGDQETLESGPPLPKLNLQFLSLRDYLYRNFLLYRIESMYSIREDLVDSLRRYARSGGGRFAIPIQSFSIKYVGPAQIGHVVPSEVRAEIVIDLASLQHNSYEAKRDWGFVKQHDVLFLTTLDWKEGGPRNAEARPQFVRGCEVMDVRDEADNIFTGIGESNFKLVGSVRKIRVLLDAVQYHEDIVNHVGCYQIGFTALVRRDPKTNNFKGVLSTIRDLMNQKMAVPAWFHDVLLGYGDPKKPPAIKEGDVHMVDPEVLKSSDNLEWTARQEQAIQKGLSPGLTIIVGPPGTGKTDVTVDIISKLYHMHPDQRTLVITHSNSGLNDIFEKIVHKAIDERHLLRLGMGSKELETDKDFSKNGRTEYMLKRRDLLLKDVRNIAKELQVNDSIGDMGYTCETAAYCYKKYILPMEATIRNGSFECGSWEKINAIFEELEDCRAFELFRNFYDRGNFLLCRQTRIIAMTCTHAALKRHEFHRLSFEFDNLVVEESAQILEVEAFIPIAMQKPTQEIGSRLKRIVLIGDHNQLPPIVQNLHLQRAAKFDQSMFQRLIRLGVPHVQLDAQGRMRTSLADLFRWKYDTLKDLPHTQSRTEFQHANAGFLYEYQCIDVSDSPESTPKPYFYQNLGEALAIVLTYMYMRICGHSRDSITILTTYKGQNALLDDVFARWLTKDASNDPVAVLFNKLFPNERVPKISTVDRYQGRQNDFVLLSLVRTGKVGHIRDVRRLVVAVSRARLGLYVFCNVKTFREVWELKPVFSKLLQRPTSLQFVQETHPTTRKVNEPADALDVSGNVVSGGESTLHRLVRGMLEVLQ